MPSPPTHAGRFTSEKTTLDPIVSSHSYGEERDEERIVKMRRLHQFRFIGGKKLQRESEQRDSIESFTPTADSKRDSIESFPPDEPTPTATRDDDHAPDSLEQIDESEFDTHVTAPKIYKANGRQKINRTWTCARQKRQ